MPSYTDRPISYSRISSYTYLCPYIYFARYVLGLQTARTSLNRVWGSALHGAIEEFHHHTCIYPTPEDLAKAFDDHLIARLAPFGLDHHAGQMTEFIPHLNTLYNELAERSSTPWNLKDWKTDETVIQANALEALVAAAAENTDLAYTKNEGLAKRMRQHRDIAAKYLAFDKTYKLVHHEDGRPMVEERFSVDFNEVPCMVIIDQIRTTPSGATIAVDLKSNYEAPDPAVLEHNYQLAHTQLLMRLNKDLPDPDGAGWYQLRTGDLHPIPRVSEAMEAEWAQQINMVTLAEALTLFPRRRDASCLRCYYFEEHCKDTTGPVCKP